MINDMVKIGRIISEPEYIGQGMNKSFKCISYSDGEEYPVIAKYIEDIEIIKELICSILGRLINLPIPEPILLLDNNNKFCFGSIDVGYPNLFHFLNSEDPYYLEFHSIIKNWDKIESASFFDEFILNHDRHSGNILYNGKEIMLIDHGLSIHSNHCKPDHSKDWNNILFNHLLCNFTKLSCQHKLNKNELCNKLNNWCKEINDHNLIDEVANKLPIADQSTNKLLSFLQQRSRFIANIINSKINPHQMDFVND